jgi:hypothetical protein
MLRDRDYFVVEPFVQIPFLIHGFGTRYWKEEDFVSAPDLADFHRVSLRQTHSDIIRVITQFPQEKMEGDVMVTNLPGILLIIKTADCLPVLVVDTQNRAVGAVHCGWRGTRKRVIEKALRTMQRSYGSDFASLCVALGPCISRTCYEVGEDVREKYKGEGLQRGVFDDHPSKKKKYLFDLKGANRAQILAMGIPENNIFSVDLCTHCEEDLFSYRRDRGHAGRLINFIGILL